MLSDFTATANAIAATTKKSEKERILAEYLRSLDDASLERAAVFFSGSPFARRTASTRRPKALAMDDSTSPSTSPMRSSPVMIFTT